MAKCRLLIVDDNRDYLDQLEKTIEEEHIPYAKEKSIELIIEKAYSPEELEERSKNTYDIILSDLCLTDKDEDDPGNSTAIQWLEKIKDTEPIIILLSAYIDDDEIVQSIVKKLTGIRIVTKELASLWKLQLFSALDQFQSYSMPIKYMDRNLIKFIRQFHGKEDLTVRHMAILFADIRNFTNLCDYFQEKQDILFQHMEVYFDEVEKIIYKHGGIFDKILGDGIMAEFIDEITPHNYLKCALEATEKLVGQFNKLKEKLNENLLHREKEKEAEKIIEELSLGCGVYAGNINFGRFGGEKRKHFTAMGHEVNMAQRLESAARIDSIPPEYRQGIQDGQKVGAIIFLADIVANRLVIKEEMEHYKQVPTTSKEAVSKQWHNKKLYIKNYNNNNINRNAYCRIIP